MAADCPDDRPELCHQSNGEHGTMCAVDLIRSRKMCFLVSVSPDMTICILEERPPWWVLALSRVSDDEWSSEKRRGWQCCGCLTHGKGGERLRRASGQETQDCHSLRLVGACLSLSEEKKCFLSSVNESR
jgi:hypothetical protein